MNLPRCLRHAFAAAFVLSAAFASLPALAQDVAPVIVRVRPPSDEQLATAIEKVEADFPLPANDLLTASGVVKQLQEEAARETKDLARRLALRKVASRYAAQLGMWREALVIADKTSAEFNVPIAATRGEVVAKIAEHHEAASTDGLGDFDLARLIADTIEGCLVEDQFDACQRLVAELEQVEARGALGADARAANYRVHIVRVRGEYEKVAHHLKRLEEDPLDPNANQAVADYYFLAKQDWEAALPHYALGTSDALRLAARRDLERPIDPRSQQALSQEYLRLIGVPGVNWDFAKSRSDYWRSMARVSDRNFFINPGAVAPDDGVISRNPLPQIVGASAARRARPEGASLLLTFDDSTISPTTGQSQSLTLAGRTVNGERVVIYDLSPRGNHVEAWKPSSTIRQRGIGDAWNASGTPLLVSRRLIADLPAFTWTGWMRVSSSAQPETFLAEGEKISDAELRSSSSGVRLRRTGSPYPSFEIPSLFGGKSGTTKPRVLIDTEPSFNDRWMFVAVTMNHAQQLRVTINSRSETVRMGLMAPGMDEGYALLGSCMGVLDEITFYPRPLSLAEVNALFHLGLQGRPVAEYSFGGRQPSIPKLARILYPEAGQPLANNGQPRNDPPQSAAKPKLPKPSDEEIEKAQKDIRELYAADFLAAKADDKRRMLAAKLRQVAQETRDAPAARYALLAMAADLLSTSGSTDAIAVWDELAQEFDISVVKEKRELLDTIAKKLPRSAAGDFKRLADQYVVLLNQAIQRDDYKEAELLASRAETCVKRAGDNVLERMIDAGVKELRLMAKAYEAAKGAQETLKTNPNDAAAATTWGRYLCLYRNRWDEGLPLLRKGADDPLVQLAKQDGANPDKSALQITLGDAWWAAAEAEKDEFASKSLKRRAVHWYEKAVAQSSGIAAKRLQKRIDDFLAESSPIPVNEWVDALSMIDTAAHAVDCTLVRQGSAVGVLPNRSNVSRMMVPIGLHGSYEMMMRFEYNGSGGDITYFLPIKDRHVQVTVGGLMRVYTQRGSSGETLMPSVYLERRKVYNIAAKVSVDDEDNAVVQVTFNGRPAVQWQGPVSDLRVDALGQNRVRSPRFGPPRFGPPRAAGAAPEFGAEPEGNTSPPVIVVQGGPSDAYLVPMFQVKLTKGWAEAILK